MKIKSLLKHNLMRAAMTLALIMACATAWAQTTQSVTYIDENGQTQTVDATLLTASTYSTNMSGWYVASGTFTNNNRLAVNYDYATLNLILADDCHLTMTRGLQVPSHATLNIYSQSKGSSMGKLTITTPDNSYAGIGGSANPNQSIPSGNINIYGGDLNITGGSGGAGIGGGRQAAAQGAILITNGAKVVATGGFSGAGIGGGYQASFSSITITGNATVTASATNGGEAIGRGQGASQSGTLSITNSTVNNVHYDADGFQDGSTHTVTFNSQGGTAVAAQTVGLKYGQTIVKANEPTVPTRTYYVFGGWYKESNCTNAWDFDNDAVTEDITLYAKWTPDPDHFSVSDDGNTYTIHTATGWGLFCDALQDNATYNRFIGKTVKLEADISVTRMAGGSDHDFMGTFDGQGHTLTVAYGSAESPITAAKAAPFVNVESGCIIENLHVAGDIYTSGQNAAGIAGTQYGAVTIRNCRVSTAIHSYTSGDGTHGGLVGNNGNGNGSALSIVGCVFDGKLLTEGATATIKCGGFVGWRHSEVTISNSLFAPTEVTIGTTSSATFARNGATITNCYYTTDFNDGEHFTAQGKQARSITAGNYVTVENAGMDTTYSTSGITSYGTGIKYNDVLYAGKNEVVSLTLSNTVPASFNFTGYSVTEGATLNASGNDYTLTMPNAEVDVVITANYTIPSVSYIDENGAAQTCTYYYPLEGTETTLGTAGQETWFVVQGTLNYTHGIQFLGNTHIILCDGAAMNIGTSDNPVSGEPYQENVGFYGGETFNLSLYAQSGNTGTLTIYSNRMSFYVKDLTIAGGNVNTTTVTDSPVIACNNNLTVRRSALEIHTNGPAVQANGDVALSNVTANINSSNNVGFSCSNFAVDNSQLTVNTRAEAIVANNGIITLSNVTANLNSSNGFGLVCSNFTVDNSQLTVTAPNPAIRASVITLGCTAATDFIKATNTSSLNYSYYGTVKIADGQTLYDGANAYTGTLTDAERQTIGGRKLTNVAPPTYDYIGLNGTGATHTAVVIDADNMPTALSGWYIVQGTVSYTNTIDLAGDTHIILADNAVMNVTVTGYNNGIQSTSGNNYSLFVYGQTGQSGELNVTSDRFACYIYGGDITIAGGKVTASGTTGIFVQYYNNNGGNVTIKNATVTATGTSYNGILSEYGGNITIDNSNVTATSTGSYVIFAQKGGITIDNSNVTATATNNGTVIYAGKGDITIANGTVTASGTQYGIFTENGSVTINGGQVTATGNFGIYTIGSVTINGGQVTATGNNYGIFAQNSSDHITLGWTNPTDFIYVNKYYTYGTLSIAEGKTFIDEDGQTYSGTIAQESGAYPINGKTLYPGVVKQVAGYGEGNGGWVFIASPVAESIAPSEVHNIFPSAGETSNEYDLYRFNQSSSNGKEWQNWKATTTENHPDFTSLVNGQGYLYASKETRTLVFAGEFRATTEPVEVPLDYDENAQFAGWNLVGNPFTTQATMTNGNGQPVSFYVINGQNVVPYEGSAAIEPCTGVMVKAEGTGEKVRFTSVSPDNAPQPNNGSLQIALSQVPEPVEGPARNDNVYSGVGVSTSSTTLIDNAIISFNEGSKLIKFYFGTQNANIYIPQDNEEYAIAFSESQGEMPLNFKAETDGTYTISVNVDNVEMGYLHLIDNMTGADIDLLAANGGNARHGDARHGDAINRVSTYTFSAKTTDYESRFKLVFSVGVPADGDNEAFAFIDASGNIIVNGTGTLQVIDMTGRVLYTAEANSAFRIQHSAFPTPGVYVLRLINGDDVRTQKIVVE